MPDQGRSGRNALQVPGAAEENYESSQGVLRPVLKTTRIHASDQVWRNCQEHSSVMAVVTTQALTLGRGVGPSSGAQATLPISHTGLAWCQLCS